MPKLILLRHGQSQWNLENRFTGWIDVDLSPQGEKEAEMAGQLLQNLPIDAVFSSVLKRAIRTAEIALQAAGKNSLQIIKDPALNERMYGDLQGMNKDEARKIFGAETVQLWRRSYDIAPPNGESLKDVQARVIPYYKKHIEPLLQEGKNVLVVAHGNSLRALVAYLEDLTPEEILKLEIPTGIPIVYEFDDRLNIIEKHILQPDTAVSGGKEV